MPDVEMCLDTTCPVRDKCVHFTTIADHEGWQEYGGYKHTSEEGCAEFLPEKKRK